MTAMSVPQNNDLTQQNDSEFVSRGPCRLCGKLFTKAAMTTHLKACFPKHTAAPPDGKPMARGFLLLVDGGRYAPEYWLHLAAPVDATFGALDSVLRDIWLECCGHMSAFRFPQRKAQRATPKSLANIFSNTFDVDQAMDEDEKLMGKTLASKFRVGSRVTHDYDFGTTTTLEVRVVAGIEMPVAKKSGIRLLARNEPPPIPCGQCGAPAAWVCSECMYAGTGWVCKKCRRTHSCGEDMLLPVVNSPRVGQCGYCGPSREP